MSREIRIIVDDDEVFERMRRQKDAMDLSWEDALRRGLRQADSEPPDPDQPPSPFDDDFREQLRARIKDSVPTDPDPPHRSPTSSTPPFIDGTAISRMVNKQLEQALAGLTAPPEGDDRDLDAELDALEDAEDALLTFPQLDADDATVPLRVNLTTRGDGLDITVVAVRRGKGTEHQNAFAADQRERLTKSLATGTPATLSFRDGAETYDVVPSLTWGRDADGNPTVVDVTIEDVLLDD